MPLTNLSGKTKADLIVLAELSGLLTATKAKRMTKAAIVEFLQTIEKENIEQKNEEDASTRKKDVILDESKAAKTKSKKTPAKRKPVKSSDKTVTKSTSKPTAKTSPETTKKTTKSEVKKKEQIKNEAKPARREQPDKKPVTVFEDRDEKNQTSEDQPATIGATKDSFDKPTERSARPIKSGQKRNISQHQVSNRTSTKKQIPINKSQNKQVNRNDELNTTSDVQGATAVSDQKIQQMEKSPPTSANDKKNDNGSDTKQQVIRTGEENKPHRLIVEAGELVSGTLEIMPDGYGFLRKDNYLQGSKDIYVPPQYIRRFGLRTGDWVAGPGKQQRDTDRYQALLYIKEVNGLPPEKMTRRPQFDRLTPIYPDSRYRLETARNELSTRIIDLAAPIGKGQRGMIVSPPKAGKTILLQKIANAISINNPEVKLIVLLIDERPEEVTDMQRSIKGEVVYSTFDKTPENHVKVTELVLERAMRLVELKQDVVILLDSMTRLARAYNLTINPTGRTLSGGLDPGALYGPKRFFGAARNIENGGSLTIISTALIETGSRMDEVIFEEFKGTGNMEVYLDRKLSEKRIFPAIDINRSGTRREELLMTSTELDAVWTIRKAFSQLETASVTETIINLLLKTQNNDHFISSINVSFNDKNVFDAMRGSRTGNGNAPTTGQGNMNGKQY